MTFRTQMIAALAATLTVVGLAGAAPQQMILFRQTIRVGPKGGRLVAACGYREGAPPSRSDRYTHVSGPARVTPISGDGTRGPSVPLTEAISKGWLKVLGDGTDAMRVEPTEKLPGREFEIHVPETSRLATSKELLEEQLTREKGVDLAKVVARIEEARQKLRPLFGDRLPSDIQGIVWNTQDKNPANRKRAEALLKALEDAAGRLDERAAKAWTDAVAELRTSAAGSQPVERMLERKIDVLRKSYTSDKEGEREKSVKGLEELKGRVAQWQKDHDAFLKQVKVVSNDAETALPPEQAAQFERRLEFLLSRHLDAPSGRKSAEADLATLSAGLSRLRDARDIVKRFAEAHEGLGDSLPARLREEVNDRSDSVFEFRRWATEPGARQARAELERLTADLKRFRDPEVVKVRAEFDRMEGEVAKWDGSPIQSEMLSRVWRARTAFTWGDGAGQARAREQLGQFTEAVARVGTREGRDCVELARDLQRLMGTLRIRDFSLSFTASNNLQAWVRLFLEGSPVEARLAHGRMQDFAVRVRELTGDPPPTYLAAASKAVASFKELDTARRVVGAIRLNELKQVCAWGKTLKERQAAERELEGLPETLKKVDPAVAKELGDRLRTYETELFGSEPAFPVSKWADYLRLTLRDVVLETGPRQAAARERWLAFSEHLKSARKAVAETAAKPTAKPLFEDGKLLLQVGDNKLPAERAAPEGTNLLVDARGLKPEQFEQLVKEAGESKGQLVLLDSESGPEQFRRLPNAERPTLLNDSQAVEKGASPEKRLQFLSWLENVATDFRGVVSSGARGRVDVVVDHFGSKTFERLYERLEKGEFAGRHVVLLICNTDLPMFRKFARDARTRGGALSVTYPRVSLQLAPAPLILEVLREPGRLTPGLSPAAMVERAAATVRERLERCLKAADKGRAIREEFPAAGGDPAELFRVEGKFNDKLLEEMIEQLKGNQYRFQPQVRTVVPQADVGLG